MRILASFLVLLLTATAPVLAQQEPPARVGRVAYAAGNLSFRVAGDGQWSQAGVNYPVATGGSFWTDPQGRAEIAVGPTTIALAGGTELDVVNLSEQTTQLGLPQGRVFLRLRQLAQGQSVEVDLPQGGVWLLQPGAYDIDAGAGDRPGRVQAFEGSARFAGGGADLEISAGNAAILTGSNPVAAQLEPAVADEFVEWCRARDTERSRVAAPRYVSPQMTGYAELDPYGDWRSSPQYGEVWYPSQVPTGWAPYRDGHWISVPPWGWTWVDDQPWGFAPSHYGRWAYVDDRWGWVPGQFAPQPVYAPALVAFVGAGIAAAAVGPSVGWFPLAPGEVYWPSYTHNAYYIRNVNITNVSNINTVIVNNQGAPPAQVAGAAFANRQFATVVPQHVFAGAGNVAPAMVRVPQATLRQAPVSVQPPRVTPVALPAKAAGPPVVERHPAPASVTASQPAPTHPGQPPRAPEGAAQHAPAMPGLSPPSSPAAALPPRTPGSPEHSREVSRGTTTEPVKPAGAPAAIKPASPSPEAVRQPVAPEPQRPAASREPSATGAAHAPPPVVAPRQPPAQTRVSRPPETVRPASPAAQTQVFRPPQTFRPVQPPAARAPVATAPAHPPAAPVRRAVPAAQPPAPTVERAARPAAPRPAATAVRAPPPAQPHPQAAQKVAPAAHDAHKKGENERPN